MLELTWQNCYNIAVRGETRMAKLLYPKWHPNAATGIGGEICKLM